MFLTVNAKNNKTRSYKGQELLARIYNKEKNSPTIEQSYQIYYLLRQINRIKREQPIDMGKNCKRKHKQKQKTIDLETIQNLAYNRQNKIDYSLPKVKYNTKLKEKSNFNKNRDILLLRWLSMRIIY